MEVLKIAEKKYKVNGELLSRSYNKMIQWFSDICLVIVTSTFSDQGAEEASTTAGSSDWSRWCLVWTRAGIQRQGHVHDPRVSGGEG